MVSILCHACSSPKHEPWLSSSAYIYIPCLDGPHPYYTILHCHCHFYGIYTETK